MTIVSKAAPLIPLMTADNSVICKCENTAANNLQAAIGPNFLSLLLSSAGEQTAKNEVSSEQKPEVKQKNNSKEEDTAYLYGLPISYNSENEPDRSIIPTAPTSGKSPAALQTDSAVSGKKILPADNAAEFFFSPVTIRKANPKEILSSPHINRTQYPDTESLVNGKEILSKPLPDSIPVRHESNFADIKEMPLKAKSDIPNEESFRILHPLFEKPQILTEVGLKSEYGTPNNSQAVTVTGVESTYIKQPDSVTAAQSVQIRQEVMLTPENIPPFLSGIASHQTELKPKASAADIDGSIKDPIYPNQKEPETLSVNTVREMMSANRLNASAEKRAPLVYHPKDAEFDEKNLRSEDTSPAKALYGIKAIRNQSEPIAVAEIRTDKADSVSQSIAQQVVTAIQPFLKKGADSSFRIKLKPEGLGEIFVELRHGSDKLDIVIKTELSSTGELLKDGLDELKAQLALKCERTELHLSSFTAKQESGQIIASLPGSLTADSGESRQGRQGTDTGRGGTETAYGSLHIPQEKKPVTATRYRSGLIDCLA